MSGMGFAFLHEKPVSFFFHTWLLSFSRERFQPGIVCGAAVMPSNIDDDNTMRLRLIG